MKINNRFHLIALSLIFAVTVAYSFSLALKRYNNYEYGKFDLGNMSQIVYNTAHGRFMEVTDQFGTNMPRWGMSHVDPILLLFVPLFWIYASPMLLVFVQHVSLISAIFPIFFLTLRKTKNQYISYAFVLTYILYPAIGYSLVWTTFHGISFVSSILMWVVYFLEVNDFLKGEKMFSKKSLIYWSLVILMLAGKEEIGFILGAASFFLFFKNKKLALYTAAVSIIWSVISFVVIIPAYSDVRKASVLDFINQAGIGDTNTALVTGENFFLTRYSYLGASYGEIFINLFTTKDGLNKMLSKENIMAINQLTQPFLYIPAVIPAWVATAPDLAIVMISREKIFNINNHRIALIITALFLSYLYFVYLLDYKLKDKKGLKYIPIIFAYAVVVSTIVSSLEFDNPLVVSGKSFLMDKIVSKIYAETLVSVDSPDLKVGDISKSKLPLNNVECLTKVNDMIQSYNPQIYTGPDYLGAQTSLRYVNALFPGHIYDADVAAVDLFDDKPLQRVRAPLWTANKLALTRMLNNNSYKQVYSCGKVVLFVRGENRDSVQAADTLSGVYTFYNIEYRDLKVKVGFKDLPTIVSISNPQPYRLALQRIEGNFTEKVSYWVFRNKNDKENKFDFIDYTTSGFKDNLMTVQPGGQYIVEKYYPILNGLKEGQYSVSYGIGNTVGSREVYLGDVEVKK